MISCKNDKVNIFQGCKYGVSKKLLFSKQYDYLTYKYQYHFKVSCENQKITS